jgi:hypothetical protein
LIPAEEQVTRAVHELHGVVLSTAIGMVLSGTALPSLVHLSGCQAAREGQVQALSSDNGLKIGVLAHGAPVFLAQATGSLATAGALLGLCAPLAAAEACAPSPWIRWWLGDWIAVAPDGKGVDPVKGRQGHGVRKALGSTCGCAQESAAFI